MLKGAGRDDVYSESLFDVICVFVLDDVQVDFNFIFVLLLEYAIVFILIFIVIIAFIAACFKSFVFISSFFFELP